jgi:DNA polymerase I-like protein with 3'-5' exonuclease and polymerase domains
MNIYAIDFETYYSKDVSIGEQGVYHYLRHPEQDIYLVSIAGTDGTRYTGHPKNAPWSTICEGSPTWLSHNTGFDMPVFMRLQELGIAPEYLRLTDWHDTADLAAFLGVPRSLKESSFHLLGIPVNKDTRDKMKGKRWDDMTPEFRAEVIAYAQADADNCLKLWLEHSHKWPEHERNISKMTREMCYVGVPLDEESLQQAQTSLSELVWQAESKVPWVQEGQPVLSPLAIRAECSKLGIEAPDSFAEKDADAMLWEEKYSELYLWIKAIRNYRKANKHLKTVQTMLSRLRHEGPYGGTMAYGLKYFGAHTGRDSGDAGWNAQNLPKGKVAGVDLRATIKAKPGHTFLIVDLSQIEPRCLHWLAKDKVMLDYIRQSSDLYYAQAKAWGLYDGEEKNFKGSPSRHTMKQLALGLGYGMGAKKFADVAGVDAAEAARLTTLYRTKNPLVTKLWKDLEDTLRKTARSQDEKDALVELPSGRNLTYRNVSSDHGGLTCELPRNGKMVRLGTWGGSLTENLVQAVARDVFMDRCVALYNLNLKCVMRVHDEAVIEVPKDRAEELLGVTITTMTTAPQWASGLPLAAEGIISDTYTK